jgi:hypothetical protein
MTLTGRTLLPHTVRARSGRIWPPGAGVLSRHRLHFSPAATMPVMRRRGDGRHTALRRVDGIAVSDWHGRETTRAEPLRAASAWHSMIVNVM